MEHGDQRPARSFPGVDGLPPPTPRTLMRQGMLLNPKAPFCERRDNPSARSSEALRSREERPIAASFLHCSGFGSSPPSSRSHEDSM
eukprot:scaffold1778_cov246-Pinguiococcus_pyrenoidosus.AAC.16